MNRSISIMAIIIIIFTFLCSVGMSTASPVPALDLTSAEIRFIKEHPVITLGVAKSFDPFVNVNEDGVYYGYDIDITNYISEMTGLEFRFEIGDWAGILRRAEERELDGVSCSIPSPGRAKYFDFTIPYAEYSSIVIVRKNNPASIHSMKDLRGKRAVVMANNINSHNDIRELDLDVEIIREPDLYNVIRSVAMGQSDFTIGGEPVHYLAAKLGMAGFLKTAFPTGSTAAFCFSLRNDWPELVSIFNKALRSIPQDKMVTVRNKWLSGAAWDPVTGDGRIKLTDVESDFLSINHSLGVGVKGDHLPFSQFTSGDRLQGMAEDFIRLAEQGLGPGLRLLPVQSSEPMKDLLSNRCDLLIMCLKPDHDVPGVLFTTPYLSFPYVIVTTLDKRFEMNFQPEDGQVFAVPDAADVIGELKDNYPGIALVEVPSVSDGLRGVRNGKYHGLIAASPVVTHEIQTSFLTELKITGQTGLTAEYAVATRASSPLVNRIFQKIVGSMSDKEKRQIVNKWMAVKYEKGVDLSLIWKIVAAAALLLVGAIIWNRKLGIAKRRAEEALAAERQAIQANINFIDMISHEYRSPLTVISSNLDLIEEKSAGGRVGNVDKEVGRMRNSAKRLLNIFEKSLLNIRMDNASILPDKQDVDLGHVVESAVRDIKAAHPDHVVDIESDGAPLVVHADPDLLNFAVLNIVDNACKYSPSGGRVSVSLELTQGKAHLRVRDQGVGIGDEDIGHVFEKFFRSPNVGTKRGVGMGLYLVKNIVDLHHGDIRVISSLGHGTTFTIRFPEARKE